jgi:hypothetical protein
MSIDIEARVDAGVDTSAFDATVVIGLVSESEFPGARAAMPELNDCADYQEWLDFREGLQMSLAMAGVDVRMATVSLSSFLAWCRAAGQPPTEQSLDAFAALRAPPREAPAVGAFVRRADFERYRGAVAALARCQNYEAWLRHREARRRRSRRVFVDFPVQIRDFLVWCTCLGEGTSEASLDTYAGLMKEYAEV